MVTTTVPITAGSGTPIAVEQTAAISGSVQIMALSNPDGSRLPYDPDGTIQVSPEPTTLLLDEFGAQAITVFNTVGSGNSGVTPTASNGNVAISAGTASGGYAVLRSTNAFWLRAGTYLRVAHIVQYETAATTNSTRWWGYGVNQTTPTATAPVLNGAVWQLDSSAGAFQAAIYSAGTKAVVATLNRATDGLQHRYEISYRQSIVYWVMDGLVVASRTFPNLAVATGLYAIVGAANAAAITAPTFNLSSESVADQGGNNRTISDGLNPGLQATVKTGSTAIATTDFPLAVGLHPSSSLPSGINVIGSVIAGVGATTPNGAFYTSTTTNAATVLKTSSGQLQTLLISNTATSAQYVKLFNATAVTLGTTAAVVDIPIAAGTTLTLNLGANGQRFTTGIAYAVTGAAGAANNTAGAGGVYLAATYV